MSKQSCVSECPGGTGCCSLLPSSHSFAADQWLFLLLHSGWLLVSGITGGFVSWIIFLWAHTLCRGEWGRASLVTFFKGCPAPNKHPHYHPMPKARAKLPWGQQEPPPPSAALSILLGHCWKCWWQMLLYELTYDGFQEQWTTLQLETKFPCYRTVFLLLHSIPLLEGEPLLTFCTNWGLTVISWSIAFSRSSSSMHFSICTTDPVNMVSSRLGQSHLLWFWLSVLEPDSQSSSEFP